MHTITKRAVALVASAMLLAAVTGCGATVPAVTASAPQAPDILLTAQPPERGDLALSTAFVGSVSPDQVVAVVPKMGGTVKTVNVAVGQQVKKGDLLLTLDDKDLLPSLAQAEAGYNSAKAQTDQMTGSGYKSSLANLDSAYDSAFDAHENAQYNVTRLENQLEEARETKAALQPKIDDGSATAEEIADYRSAVASIGMLPSSIESAEAGADMARKQFNNARNSYNAMKTEGEVELQNVADATLKQAEAGLNVAKQQLENTKLYSPIDGVIESVSATELNALSPSAPAFVIANKSAISVTFNVSSASVLSMQVGDTVRVEKGQNTYDATITEVGNIVNAQTGLFSVKATIENAGNDLLTGVSVKVSADTQKAQNALLVAQDSIYYDDGKPYLYLMTEGEGGVKTAVKTFVETGISNPQQIVILSGISESDLVITSWHPNLIDGAVVALATENTEEPATETAAEPVALQEG